MPVDIVQGLPQHFGVRTIDTTPRDHSCLTIFQLFSNISRNVGRQVNAPGNDLLMEVVVWRTKNIVVVRENAVDRVAHKSHVVRRLRKKTMYAVVEMTNQCGNFPFAIDTQILDRRFKRDAALRNDPFHPGFSIAMLKNLPEGRSRAFRDVEKYHTVVFSVVAFYIHSWSPGAHIKSLSSKNSQP